MKKNRIWEIDLLRTIAIILMIAFHTVYDLNYYAEVKINYESPIWNYIAVLSGLLFIFISGISSGFSKNSFKRGLMVFGYGMLITFITYLFESKDYVRFGILHFLGISMMLFPILKRLRETFLILISIASIGIGMYFEKVILNTKLLLPLGIMYHGFSSIDYYPIFPYLGVFIFGIIVYKKVYINKKSVFKLKPNIPLIDVISRNSLNIYLLHQPIIIGIILFIKKIRF